MPKLGEIKYGKDIGKPTYPSCRYIWFACVDCGSERWVASIGGKPVSLRCMSCSNRLKIHPHLYADKAPHWKGGRANDGRGYIRVKLQPDDFFFPMADHKGYVAEHRLVIAKHLGRLLHRWELVHHKGIRYSGIENKSDNLKDNLGLTATIGEHISNHIKGYKDGFRKGYADGRDKRVKELEAIASIK